MKLSFFACILVLLFSFVAHPVLALDTDDGLVAYWALNEEGGETATDTSSNKHDGTLLGDPKWTEGYFGGALEFDGDGDEVNVPYHADLNPETFSVCFWANVTPGSTGHRAPVSCRDEPPLSGYIFYATPSNNWAFWIGPGAPPWSGVNGPAVALGDWEHITGTYGDGTMKLYVNGELSGETDTALNANAQQELLIGAGANERAAHEYLFNGKVDEVRIYNRELDEADITQVMKTDVTAVEAVNKLATCWGTLKRQY